MKERLHNNTKYNPSTLTQSEYEGIRANLRAERDRIDNDLFILDEHALRKFGATGVVVAMDDYRHGQSEREFDLGILTDDFDPKDAA